VKLCSLGALDHYGLIEVGKVAGGGISVTFSDYVIAESPRKVWRQDRPRLHQPSISLGTINPATPSSL
jgi:hypothetical protein